MQGSDPTGRTGGADTRKTPVVRRGDSASRIDAKHGVRVYDLLAFNQLTRHPVQQRGQSLSIPARHGAYSSPSDVTPKDLASLGSLDAVGSYLRLLAAARVISAQLQAAASSVVPELIDSPRQDAID